MALASAAAEDAALNGITAVAGFLSAHTATTSTTGAAEVSGGTYARVAVAWTAASAGSTSNSGALSVNIPASTTVSYFGTWTLVSSGVFEIGGALTASQAFSTAGTLAFAIGAVTLTAS